MRHLIPAIAKGHGLEAEEWSLEDDALKEIIRRYTREAGVRELERMLGRIARKIATRFATGQVLGIDGGWSVSEGQLD